MVHVHLYVSHKCINELVTCIFATVNNEQSRNTVNMDKQDNEHRTKTNKTKEIKILKA